jgi:ligand-binding sensor domain-containing protein/signal transduction histidine kinase
MGMVQSVLNLIPALVLLTICAGVAPALDSGKSLTQYSHRIWGREEGLLEPSVYSILQSRSGYIWLGTQQGLIRFNGLRFREFTHDGEAPFRNTLVRALAEDRQQNLWIGTIGAGLAFAGKDGNLIRYTTANGFPSNDVSCVGQDREGAVWACTGAGLVKIAGGHTTVFTAADGLPQDRVRATCEAADGTRWVAGSDDGLSHSQGGRFESFRGISEASDSPVNALYCAPDGAVWAGTHEGLYRIRGESVNRFTKTEGLADNNVVSLAGSEDGALWIGSRYGVSRYRDGRISTYSTSDGLSHSSVLSLCLDREGSLWAGTPTGLDQFTNSPVTPYTRREGLPGNDTSAVVEDSGGELWVGTLSEGVGRFDGRTFHPITARDGLASNRVLSLALDPSGDIWAGTDRGISRIHEGQVLQTFRGMLGNTETRSIFVDSGGTVWAGTEKGLFRFDGREFAIAGKLTGEIVALGGGRQTRLFVSTAHEGFLSLAGDSKTSPFVSAPQIGVQRTVRSYYIDSARHVAWMGTLGRGLIRWENGKVTYYRVGDGLYDSSIYAILRDRNANFWFASAKGIFRVAEDELDRFAEGKIHTIHSVPFSTGQFRFECQEMAQPAAAQSRDGRMWFSTTNGVVAVDPGRIPRNEVPPPVRVETEFVNGERTEHLDGAQLQPWEKNLEIRYTALSFVNPEKVSFRYKLEGYDRGWTDAGARREAFFTNLPPGTYRFRVIATNSDGVASSAAGLIAFTIEPQFYQRAWFFAAVTGFAGLLIWLMWWGRVTQLKREFTVVLGERARIARDLHDTIVQQLSGVMMQLHALAGRLPASREKMLLEDIIHDAEGCAIEARSSLWELRTGSSDRDFGTSLRDTACKLTRGKPVELVFEAGEVEGAITRAVEYQLLRIAGEAISNAVRHAGAATVWVACGIREGELELSVRDDGGGFVAAGEPFGHFGLAGVRERAREIGAGLNIESSAHGTAIRVTLAVSSAAERSMRGYVGI